MIQLKGPSAIGALVAVLGMTACGGGARSAYQVLIHHHTTSGSDRWIAYVGQLGVRAGLANGEGA